MRVGLVGALFPVPMLLLSRTPCNPLLRFLRIRSGQSGYSLQGATKSALVKRTLIEHYNGSVWQVGASPNVGTGDNVLTGVAAITANNVWAAGYSPLGALILHYNGAGWHVVSAPTACKLNAITAINTNDVWAVGAMGYRSCTENFDGTSWRLVSTPIMGSSDNTLQGVSGSSSQNVWAVGTIVAETDVIVVVEVSIQ